MTTQPKGMRRTGKVPLPSNPAAAGPSGPRLEAHVGAQYLLPLMSGGEARGLPGIFITRVAFQRAGFGNPMDDVVITGHDARGQLAVLEVQAKRTIDFTASDTVFADVVALAVRASQKPEFDSLRYELAVAIARTSTKIDRHIQEVLKWARGYQDSDGFFRRLKQHGVGQGMRDFVEIFRDHMHATGATSDDAAVWRLLRHFQVLAYDFEHPGSICTLYAHERCAMLLAAPDAGRASELWDTLQQIALEADAIGGDITPESLVKTIASERGFRLAGDRRLRLARDRLNEMSENVLAGIRTKVRNVRLDRRDQVNAALLALEHGRYLEIRGTGGVGKSGVLKDLAEQVGVESRAIVVAPRRLPGGGWSALQAQLGCDASARQLLTDLAGDGGGTLFIDGLDRFDDPREQATIIDLICAAVAVRDFRVVATARLDFDANARSWLPSDVLSELVEASPLVVEELSNDEVSQLQNADAALAALLQPRHPAEKLVRNLYRLDRLARGMPLAGATMYSEAQMALQWWETGDGLDDATRRDRRQLLRALAEHSLISSAPMNIGSTPSPAIDALISSGSLRELTAVHVEFAHDVLRDWALGCLLQEQNGHLSSLPLNIPAPTSLVRGLEIAARLHAENASDGTAWKRLLERISAPGAHGSWRRSVLLALVRSERACEILDRCFPELAEHGATLLTEIVRAAIAVDWQSAATLWKALGADVEKLPRNFIAPSGPAWRNLIEWSLARGDRIPNEAAASFVDLYGRWSNAFMGQDPLSPRMVERLYAWLCEVETKNHPRVSGFSAWQGARKTSGLTMTTAQEVDLRTAFLAWCKLCPSLADAYFRNVATHPHRHVLFRELILFIGSAAQAAPAAVADLFLDALSDGDDDDGSSRLRGVFAHWGNEYFPASPARRPFFDLLWANSEEGLRLVRGIVEYTVRQRSRRVTPGENCITIPFPSGTRSFPWHQSYMWARAQENSVVASALMALEAWAHLRIERGDPVESVVNDVLGPEGSPAAVLLVAIDVMLSSWPKSREVLWPFAASADLLALDRERFGFDVMNSRDSVEWVHPEPLGLASFDSLRLRPSRNTPLDSVLSQYGFRGSPQIRAAMQLALTEEAARIGQPDPSSHGMTDPRFAAMSALNQLDPANYIENEGADGATVVEYVTPMNEVLLLAEIQERVARGTTEVALHIQLVKALNQSPCPVELLERGLAWASRNATYQEAENSDDEQPFDCARYIVAALLMRDGPANLKTTHGVWARQLLFSAARIEPDRSGHVKQVPYNPAAIAAVGLVALCRDGMQQENLQMLLHLASRNDTAMVNVLRAEVAGGRLVPNEHCRSMVRLGLVSSIYARPPREDNFHNAGVDYRARQVAREKIRQEAEDTRRQQAVEKELAWLTSGGPEPTWPELPEPHPPKQRYRIPLEQTQNHTAQSRSPTRAYALDSRAGATWISIAKEFWGSAQPELLGSLLRHCWPWTSGANGVGADPGEEPGEYAYEWNDAFFRASLVAAVSTGEAGIAELLLGPMQQLPDERFFDAAAAVLNDLDVLWLGHGSVPSEMVLSIRIALAKKLVATRAWKRLVMERSSGTEMHLAGALAAFFLGQHEMGRGSTCYVLPAGIPRVASLLPMLTEIAEQAAASTFVALAFLNLLEVEPDASRLEFLSRAMAAWWLSHQVSTEFWIDPGIGSRICAWIEKAVVVDGASTAVPSKPHLTTMMDTLIRCGIPAATALNERILAM